MTSAKNIILIFLFIIFTLVALAIRDNEILRFVLEGKLVRFSDAWRQSQFCNSFPECMRISAGWFTMSIQTALIELSRLIDMPADRHQPNLLSVAGKESFLFILGEIMARFLFLSPILLCVFTLYQSFLLRALMMVSIFMTICGWARSNPLFTEQFFAYYDFASIGFILLLFFLISKEKTRGFLAAAATLVFGQLIFENLGIVTGVAIAFFTFAASDHSISLRIKKAVRRLFELALVSIGTVIALYTLILSVNGGVSDGAGVLSEYFSDAWATYGRINFQEFHDIRENFFEMIAYPSASGILLGLIAIPNILSSATALKHIKIQFWAAFGIWLGLFCTVIIGMFVSGLYYEMGRQLIPLCIATTLIWATGIPILANIIHIKKGSSS